MALIILTVHAVANFDEKRSRDILTLDADISEGQARDIRRVHRDDTDGGFRGAGDDKAAITSNLCQNLPGAVSVCSPTRSMNPELD